jgi:hypothetical protein
MDKIQPVIPIKRRNRDIDLTHAESKKLYLLFNPKNKLMPNELITEDEIKKMVDAANHRARWSSLPELLLLPLILQLWLTVCRGDIRALAMAPMFRKCP